MGSGVDLFLRACFRMEKIFIHVFSSHVNSRVGLTICGVISTHERVLIIVLQILEQVAA